MTNKRLDNIQGFLFDLDGVMYVGKHPIKGAADTIRWIREQGLPFRFCTNTTVLSKHSLLEKLKALGIPVQPDEIFGAMQAAIRFLRFLGNPTCHLLLTEDPLGDFSEFRKNDKNPDVIIVGDICKAWSYDVMHQAFLMIMNGARLVALHKGRYWQTESGLRMDIGAFVAGLEYVTGQTATVIGKPSPEFFRLALENLGLPAGQVAMVGDDINSDIGGAQAAGMMGILVKTGKYRPELIEQSSVLPDFTIDSIADLPNLIGF